MIYLDGSNRETINKIEILVQNIYLKIEIE